MKLVLRWVALVWIFIALPYTFLSFEEDFVTGFFGLLFAFLLGGLLISDLMEYYNKNK